MIRTGSNQQNQPPDSGLPSGPRPARHKDKEGGKFEATDRTWRYKDGPAQPLRQRWLGKALGMAGGRLEEVGSMESKKTVQGLCNGGGVALERTNR